MIEHPLKDINQIYDSIVDDLGIARNNFLAKKAEKKNLECRLIKEAEGESQKEREMNAYANPLWLQFEKELNRLEAIFEFKKDKKEAVKHEFMAQYLELKDNEEFLKLKKV